MVTENVELVLQKWIHCLESTIKSYHSNGFRKKEKNVLQNIIKSDLSRAKKDYSADIEGRISKKDVTYM